MVSDCNLGLESSLHKLGKSQTEDVIELSLVGLEETELDDSADKGITLEGSSGIIFLEGEELSGGLSELGENELDSPDFSLVLEAVSANNIELAEQPVLIVGLSRGLRSLVVVGVSLGHELNSSIGISTRRDAEINKQYISKSH